MFDILNSYFCAYSLFQVLFTAQQGRVCRALWGKYPHDAIHTIQKKHVVLFEITTEAQMRFQRLGVYLKNRMSPLRITKIQQLVGLTLIVRIIKEVPIFLVRSKPWFTTIPAIQSRDIGMSEFLIRQIVHEDIRYFSYKMRKFHFLITLDKRKDHAAMLINKLDDNLPIASTRMQTLTPK